jgi:hypothetical protein
MEDSMRRLAVRRIFGGFGGVALSLVIATGVSAAPPTWQSPPLILRTSDRFLELTDAAFSDSGIVAVWTEANFNTDASRVGFKVSDDSGASFGSTHLLPKSRGGAAAICGGVAKVVAAGHPTAGTWTIQIASGDLSTDVFATTTIETSSVELEEPDVACTDGRIFVSWRETVDENTSRLLVTSARLSDGIFGAPVSLGMSDRFFPTGLQLAGSGDTAYAAFIRSDSTLRVKRWFVGPGPGYALTTEPATIVGPGTSNRPAYDPYIDADGDMVAVTWAKCSHTVARVSADGGDTWGPRRIVERFGCNVADAFSSPQAMHIRGSRSALTFNISGIPNASNDYLARSPNGFNTVRKSLLGEHETHQVGFVVVNGHVKLADVFSGPNDHRIKFRREV